MAIPLTVPAIVEALATRYPDRVSVCQGERRVNWAELADRANRFSQLLVAHDITVHRERGAHDLAPWESGQGHVALLLRNCVEFFECMLGSFTARAASFNVNFRYTVSEVDELFADARPSAVVTHSEFAETVAAAITQVEGVRLVLQVPDGTGNSLFPGAQWYDHEIAAAKGGPARRDWSPDDCYILFTGGTTGRPKGVLWPQGAALAAAFSLARRDGTELETVDDVLEVVARRRRRVVMLTSPLIHGAAQWLGMNALLTGGLVVFPDNVGHLDPDDVLSVATREGVTEIGFIGDAFGRPLADALERRRWVLPSLRALVNSGAPLTSGVRDRLLGALPGVRIIDTMGSSESGRQAVSEATCGDSTGMRPTGGTVVLSERRDRVVSVGSGEIGWLARPGRLPLGYLNDPVKTALTFPTINGVHYAVPGDRARLLPDGSVEVLGRDSTTINSGGEKIFAEEVEEALLTHPAVSDALVIGRPSERWGHEVVALVATRWPVTEDELLRHGGSRLARYKLPKRTMFLEAVPRTAAGKPDHRAAQALWSEKERTSEPVERHHG